MKINDADSDSSSENSDKEGRTRDRADVANDKKKVPKID